MLLTEIGAIYVLNMKRRTDRLSSFMSVMSQCNIPKEKIIIINSIDGKTLDLDNSTDPMIIKYISRNVNVKRRNKNESKFRGELGCALSHYNAISHAVLHNYETIIIFEDDIKISDKLQISDITTYINNAVASIDDGIIYLGYGSSGKKESYNDFLYDLKWAWRAHAYVIKGKTTIQYFNKFINSHFDKTADGQYVSMGNTNKYKKFYGLKTPIFIQDYDNLKSDIRERER